MPLPVAVRLSLELFSTSTTGGRQEDCAEFLVEVLADCPSVHRHFRGKEQAYLACTSCDHRRALALEEFLTLQVPSSC